MKGVTQILAFALGPAKKKLCGNVNLQQNIEETVDCLIKGQSPKIPAIKLAHRLVNAKLNCQLLAKSRGFKNSFSQEVVKAYTLGDEKLIRGKKFIYHHNWQVLSNNDSQAEIKKNQKRLNNCLVLSGYVGRKGKKQAWIVFKGVEWDSKAKKVSFGKVRFIRARFPQSLEKQIQVGQYVAIHWDWIFALISKEEATLLTKLTERIFNYFNVISHESSIK